MMDSFQFDILATKDTSEVGMLGEYLAQRYLASERRITVGRWSLGRDSNPPCVQRTLDERLSDIPKGFLDDLYGRGETWSWDYVGVQYWSLNPQAESYLIEVKTSRPGKRKRKLKGNWRMRSRRAINRDDLKDAEQHGFHALLINVELLDG